MLNYITYCVKKKDGNFITITSSYNEQDKIIESPEILGHFISENINESIKLANEYNREKQKEEMDRIPFSEIRKISEYKKIESFVDFLGEKYNLQDE